MDCRAAHRDVFARGNILVSGPMLFESYLLAGLFGNMSDPPVTIMNPIRNREPERVADSFLKRLQSEEDPSQLLRPVVKNLEHICMMEKEHRLKTWSNYTREDGPEGVRLTYWPYRENAGVRFAAIIMLTVAKNGNDFQVISYNPSY